MVIADSILRRAKKLSIYPYQSIDQLLKTEKKGHDAYPKKNI